MLSLLLTVAKWLLPLQRPMDRAGRRGGPKGQPLVLFSRCVWDRTEDFHLYVMEGEAKVGTSPSKQVGSIGELTVRGSCQLGKP